MELIKTECNHLKRSLNSFLIKRGEEIIESSMANKLVSNVLFSTGEKYEDFEICFYDAYDNETSFDDNFFNLLNSEIEENLKIPIADDLKANYLNEIYSFLISKEALFIEDDLGYLSCKLFTIQNDETPYSWRDEISIDIGRRSLRRCLRKEIIHISDLLKNYELIENNFNNPLASLIWKGTDTDLLELIVALLETKSIDVKDKNISRKDVVKIFGQIFSKEIKDYESKLSRATDRKMNNSPFLSSLKEAFENYCKGKEK